MNDDELRIILNFENELVRKIRLCWHAVGTCFEQQCERIGSISLNLRDSDTLNKDLAPTQESNDCDLLGPRSATKGKLPLSESLASLHASTCLDDADEVVVDDRRTQPGNLTAVAPQVNGEIKSQVAW